MPLSRRQFCAAAVATPALSAAPDTTWTQAWDRALIEAAVSGQDPNYNPAEQMLKRRVGPEYSYHSSLRNQVVHPTRDALEYALMLLSLGGPERIERATKVIRRLCAIQETDPASRFYGIWGWYMEEPAPKMTPADWNWADFCGSLLLLIEMGHGAKLDTLTRQQVRDAIRHAAYSVKKRNVTMTYTNIAVQGTFVTLAAAELLSDPTLMAYATGRLRRFAAEVDRTGSFAEYNSPTYANVTIANLTRILMHVRHEESRTLAGRIHERAWLHLGRHWHAPSNQLAGPMSRCYRTDIGQPLWIQKALNGRIQFVTLEQIRERRIGNAGEVATLDYRCPDTVAPLFLKLDAPRQHRELFLPGVQGTTYLDRHYALGSVNRGNFWIQSRSVLGYLGEGGRTAGYVQMRFVKDDYDFTSALVYTVQQRNAVLGVVDFRSPGGDKHPGLDPVKDGRFQASRLRLRLDLAGAAAQGKYLQTDDAVAVDAGAVKIWLRFPASEFAGHAGRVEIEKDGELRTISLDLLREAQSVTVEWAKVGRAFAVFHLAMVETSEPLAAFAERMNKMPHQFQGEKCEWTWPAGTLSLTAALKVGTIAAQDAVFLSAVDGRPVGEFRLSDEKLV